MKSFRIIPIAMTFPLVLFGVLAAGAAEQGPVPAGDNVVSFDDYQPDKSGQSLVTGQLNKAIEAVSADPVKDTLVVSKGTYFVGSVLMKSDVRLYLMKGAVLLGSKKMSDYVQTVPPELSAKRGIVVIKDCSNVTIDGPGTIDGNWNSDAKHNLLLSNAADVTIRGVNSINHTGWNTIIYRSHDVLVDGVNIQTHPKSGNIDDGIDIVGSHDVEVANCTISVVDDGIVVKNKEKDRSPVDVYNINIHDNTVSSKFVAALKLGTETTPGTWSNILFENNRCVEGDMKIIISDGAHVKDVTFRGNRFEKSSGRRSQNEDIHIKIQDRTYGVLGKGPGTGRIDLINIEDCRFDQPKPKDAVRIEGLSAEHAIGTVRFKNVFFGDHLLTREDDLRLASKAYMDSIKFEK